MNEKDINFLAEFPLISTDTWEALIAVDLKGKDYDKTLVWRTNEGINVRPYYRAEDLESISFVGCKPNEFPFVRGNQPSGNNWLIRQEITVQDARTANKKALEILNKGVNSIGFRFESCKEIATEELSTLLKNIDLEAAEINFTMDCKNRYLLQSLLSYLKEQKFNPSKVRLSVNHDPIGRFTLRGKFCNEEKELFSKTKALVTATEMYPHLHVIAVNGKNFNNAGSSIVQELGFSMAIGAEYLAHLSDAGLDAGVVASKMRFNFGIGSNYFMELAKLRAARLLWANIVSAFKPKCYGECGEKSEDGVCYGVCKMFAHCETSSWNKTIYDPYVNLLRTQTEAMSAVLGGADSITVLPFDSTYETPTEFAERIARNQQALLKEEVHLDKIADPAAGSYYVEKLTASLADEAWKLFLKVEELGGFISAFRQGFVQTQVSEMADKRKKAIAARRENILGINQFPDFNEQLDLMPDNSCFEIFDQKVKDAEVETLKIFRGAQQFESLRYATDQYAKIKGRPKVCLLPIGNLTMRKARAQFSTNFFSVAGYEVVDHNGFQSVEEGLKTALEAKAQIVVLCSSDEEYAELAPTLFRLLNRKTILVIAGAPACMEELKTIGIENFINIKTNLLESLQAYNKKLGIC